jgi:hypothetical protein
MTTAGVTHIGRTNLFASRAAAAKPIAPSRIDARRVCEPADGEGVTTWILYRKGSFSLKERIASETLFERRKAALEQQGATHVRLVPGSESNWLRSAFELPRPVL